MLVYIIRVALFPDPAQISVTYSTVKRERSLVSFLT